MIIGISGPQGSGKTTVLAALEQRGWKLDPYKASRQVQAQLEVLNLLDAIKTPEGMKMFQGLVLEQKCRNLELMQRQLQDGEHLLTERSFADIAAYAQLWSFELVDQRRWSFSEAMAFNIEFSMRCYTMQEKWFDRVIHLPRMPHIVEENDPHRAPAKMVDFIDEQLQSFYKLQDRTATRVISALTVEDRADQIEYFINL
jgi:predicted ATPase